MIETGATKLASFFFAELVKFQPEIVMWQEKMPYKVRDILSIIKMWNTSVGTCVR